VIATTADEFLGGRVRVRQPARGFRAGLDAVMLAAAVPALPGQDVLELGAGCGTASLCLAARVDDCAVTGVEIDASLVALASANAISNDLDRRVHFEQADISAMPAALKREFSHAFANPPFHHGRQPASPDLSRARAKHDRVGLGAWVSAGLKRVVANGTFSFIVRADRLQETLASAPEGGIAIFPLWPRKCEPARRVIVQLRKGSASEMLFLAGLVLHESDGEYTIRANAVLQGKAALDLMAQSRSRG
jgi:tRNA1Val (adenine37-N6)-methyltransferase